MLHRTGSFGEVPLQKVIVALCGVLIVMIWSASTAGAAAFAGRIAYVSGDVWVERGKVREAATAGRRLLRNDVVVTGDRGRAKLVMRDGTRVYVGSRSRIEVAEYASRGRNLLSGVFNMFWGKARFFVHKLMASNARFQVRTATAVLGVRGTSFLVVQPKPPQLPPRIESFEGFARQARIPTRVVLTTGRVHLSLPDGRTIPLTQGKTADIHPDGKVEIRKTKPTDEVTAPPATLPEDKGGAQSQSGQGQSGQGHGAPGGTGQAIAGGGPGVGAGSANSAPTPPPPPPPPPGSTGNVAPSLSGSPAGNALGVGSGSGSSVAGAVNNA
ncbi:MAG: hypothetical protein D6794_07700, partial [Deltaproteobacteria bacterium]